MTGNHMIDEAPNPRARLDNDVPRGCTDRRDCACDACFECDDCGATVRANCVCEKDPVAA